MVFRVLARQHGICLHGPVVAQRSHASRGAGSRERTAVIVGGASRIGAPSCSSERDVRARRPSTAIPTRTVVVPYRPVSYLGLTMCHGAPIGPAGLKDAFPARRPSRDGTALALANRRGWWWGMRRSIVLRVARDLGTAAVTTCRDELRAEVASCASRARPLRCPSWRAS